MKESGDLLVGELAAMRQLPMPEATSPNHSSKPRSEHPATGEDQADTGDEVDRSHHREKLDRWAIQRPVKVVAQDMINGTQTSKDRNRADQARGQPDMA